MRVPAPAAALGVFAVVVLILALPHRGSPTKTATVVASWTLTPGVLNPDVTPSTIHATICVRGWTRTIRPPVSYTNRLKLEQLQAYGLSGNPSDFQEDHLVSLELGGHPTDPRNLWPEPRPHAEEVDGTENDLNARVCDGSLGLADAQREIAELKHESG